MTFRFTKILLLCFVLPISAAAQMAGGADNSGKPIDISSDTLEVDQTQQIAVFTGNVVAIQGTMNLHSDRMTVYYTRKDDPSAPKTPEASVPVPAAPKKTPAASGTMPAAGATSAISKIVVEGHVVLATPEESAQGVHGVYQVDQKIFHLTENVILTRGKNILRGTKLDYNLANGRSVLVGAGNAQIPASNGGRVRGLFVPDEKPLETPAPVKPKPAK